MITRGQYLASLYPFDPAVNIRNLDGIRKLKAIPDRELAGFLATIWDNIPSCGVKKRR